MVDFFFVMKEKKRKESCVRLLLFFQQMLTKDKCPYILSARLYSHDRIYHHSRVERKSCIIYLHTHIEF
jgi:hypothetical protein